MFRNPYQYKITFYILCFINTLGVSQTKREILSDLNLNIGLTCFKNPFKDEGLNSDMAIVSKAANLGLEFYNKKLDASIVANKIYWLSLSASNFNNDVSAWASYTQIGITKYFKLIKEKKIGVNVSHIWVAENSGSESYKNANSRSRFLFQNFYTSLAICIAPSINLTKQLHLEVKANYYYFTRADSIPTGFNNTRLQFSLIYKINPLKNKS